MLVRILLLGIWPRKIKTMSTSDSVSEMCIAVVYSQSFYSKLPQTRTPQYPSTSKGPNKLWYIHTMEYYAARAENKLHWWSLQHRRTSKMIVVEWWYMLSSRSQRVTFPVTAFMTFWKRINSDRAKISGNTGCRRAQCMCEERIHGNFFELIEAFLIFAVMLVIQMGQQGRCTLKKKSLYMKF